MVKIKQKCLRAPMNLLETLKNIARLQGMTLNGLIITALWEYVNIWKEQEQR